MFKKILIVLAVVAFSLGLASLAVAEVAEKGPLSLSVRGNVINSDIFCDSEDAEFESETDFGFGVAAEYDLPYDLSVEAAIDRLNFFDDSDEKFDSTVLSLSLKYNFEQLEDYKLVPYVLGGIGYMNNDYSLYHVDDSFETHVGAGLNYLINDSWSLYAEGRYLWSGADVSDLQAVAENGIDRYKVDLDSFIGMAGLKYRF